MNRPATLHDSPSIKKRCIAIARVGSVFVMLVVVFCVTGIEPLEEYRLSSGLIRPADRTLQCCPRRSSLVRPQDSSPLRTLLPRLEGLLRELLSNRYKAECPVQLHQLPEPGN